MSRLYLRNFCRAERAWLVDTVEALVRAESPTTDKAAVDRCGRELAARLAAIGGRVTTLSRAERGDHVMAHFGPEGERQVLLLGHFDTVWPVGQLERMPIRRDAGRLHGPGIFDMKAGIAIGMLAARSLLETGASLARPLTMLWTTDEEVGSQTSRDVIEEQARRSGAVLVLEPSLPGGAVKTSRKGCAGCEVVVRGVAAHAGIEPQKGANAVQELALQIPRISALQDLDRGLHVNVVQAWGGTRANVIPDEAHALVDIRVPALEGWTEVMEAFTRLTPVDPRTRIEARGWLDRPPMERSAGVARLYEQAAAIARTFGSDLAEGGTGGGSDGNFTAALGVPTLDGLGAAGGGAHAADEHVIEDSLPDRAALVAALVADLQ